MSDGSLTALSSQQYHRDEDGDGGLDQDLRRQGGHLVDRIRDGVHDLTGDRRFSCRDPRRPRCSHRRSDRIPCAHGGTAPARGKELQTVVVPSVTPRIGPRHPSRAGNHAGAGRHTPRPVMEHTATTRFEPTEPVELGQTGVTVTRLGLGTTPSAASAGAAQPRRGHRSRRGGLGCRHAFRRHGPALRLRVGGARGRRGTSSPPARLVRDLHQGGSILRDSGPDGREDRTILYRGQQRYKTAGAVRLLAGLSGFDDLRLATLVSRSSYRFADAAESVLPFRDGIGRSVVWSRTTCTSGGGSRRPTWTSIRRVSYPGSRAIETPRVLASSTMPSSSGTRTTTLRRDPVWHGATGFATCGGVSATSTPCSPTRRSRAAS